MNKFTARSLVGEAMIMGRDVVVISSHPSEARVAFDIVASEAAKHDWPGTRMERHHGGERIDFGTGKISFTTASSAVRGMSADIVFVEERAREVLNAIGTRDLSSVDLSLIAAPNGEVVYA